MKNSTLVSLFAVGAALTLGTAGCAHKPNTPLTVLPDGTTQIVPPTPIRTSPPTPPPTSSDMGPGRGASIDNPTPVVSNPEGIKTDDAGHWKDVIANGTPDSTILKDDTVYFDFDSATIKKTEADKLNAVAAFLKDHHADALRVEGNCDERGTEKYNLSLGQRRADAVREYLANLKVDANQVATVSYGAAKPAVQGHNEAAWSKNRRGDFVVLIPKTGE